MRAVAVLIVALVGAACVNLDHPRVSGQLDAPTDAPRERPLSEVAPPDAPGEDVPMALPDAPPDAEEGDLPAGPDVPPEALPLENGRPCDNAGQCGSGFCAQGVCCSADCAGVCQACNLPGQEGTCQLVVAGEDPRDSCTRELPASCGQDGTCDGAGGCRRYPLGAECEAGRCMAGVEYAARTCDGAGLCRPTTSRACAAGTCTGDTCASPCSAANPCQAGFVCEAGKCALTRPTGTPCTTGTQCASGFCVEGVCCTSSCAETCFSCKITGKVGTCTAVPSGEDPRMQCLAQPTTTCGRAGGCNGTGGCRLHPAGTVCGGSSCSGSTETLAPTCDGISVCRPGSGSVRDCTPYACGDSACATSCTDSSRCAPGFSCQGNVCARVPGLLLFWRFEDAGATVVDSSGSNHNGTLDGTGGGPTRDSNVKPLMYPNTTSRAFTQASRHAIKSDPLPSALRLVNNFTITLWYRAPRVDMNGDGDLVGSELVSGANAYLLRLRQGGDIEFSKRQPGAPYQCRAPAPNYLDGNWHHVAAVASSTTGVRVYYDGAVICTSTNTADVSYSGAGTGFWVGRHGGTETQWDFEGNMDEVRIYNRPLTAPEVTALFQGRNN